MTVEYAITAAGALTTAVGLPLGVPLLPLLELEPLEDDELVEPPDDEELLETPEDEELDDDDEEELLELPEEEELALPLEEPPLHPAKTTVSNTMARSGFNISRLRSGGAEGPLPFIFITTE